MVPKKIDEKEVVVVVNDDKDEVEEGENEEDTVVKAKREDDEDCKRLNELLVEIEEAEKISKELTAAGGKVEIK